jgi:hypothetical protein
MGGIAHMRRPALYTPRPATDLSAWSHPYATGSFNPVFYADGDPAVTPPVPNPAVPNPADPPRPGPPAAVPEFTQVDLDRVAAREKAQGKRSGLKEFAERLGFGTSEDAEAFIARARKVEEDKLSEQEKRENELAAREQALTAKEAAATVRERVANHRAILVGLGAIGVDLDDAAALLRVDDTADEAAVTAAAEALKTRRPELFGVTPTPAPGTGTPPAPSGSPAGGPPPRQTPSGKPGDRGREMARIRGHVPAAG